MNYIRKISVGADYKNAMHYVVDQKVMGGEWTIHAVSQDEQGYHLWIQKNEEIKKWKFFNLNTPITIEYNVFF